MLCINDLQMRWLSKSVTDTPGIICLMSNLLISASELDSKDRDRCAPCRRLGASEALWGRGLPPGSRAGQHCAEALTAAAPAAPAPCRAPPRRAIVGRHDETALARAAEEKDQHETEAATEAGGGLPATAAPLQKSATSSSLLRHVPARPSPRPTHDEDLGNYLLGAESQLLVHGLPRWADGRTAGWLLEAVAHVDGLQLLAVGDGPRGAGRARARRRARGLARSFARPPRAIPPDCRALHRGPYSACARRRLPAGYNLHIFRSDGAWLPCEATGRALPALPAPRRARRGAHPLTRQPRPPAAPSRGPPPSRAALWLQ